MSYILLRITPGGAKGGTANLEEELAISEDRDALEAYAIDSHCDKVGEPEKFSWDPYFVIRRSEMIVIIP